RQPCQEDAGHSHAGGQAPRLPRRPRARVRSAAQRRDQRPGNRERDLRGRPCGGGADQSRRRTAGGPPARDSIRQRRHPRPASGPPMTTVQRVHNFSAGPAVLPLPVLDEIQRDLVSLPGVGMSILEISHRSAPFERILAEAEQSIRTLANIPADYQVLFLQGGASLQFSMVPMNLLGAGATADYIDCGSWAEKAIKEAKKVGAVNVAASTRGENYSRLPRQEELQLTPGAAYVHMTSNNTIEGTEYKTLPSVGDVPLVSDTSSDMFSRPIDV